MAALGLADLVSSSSAPLPCTYPGSFRPLMPIDVDEETPLIPAFTVEPTPLPWGQFSIILLIQLAEPLTSQLILPFAPQVRRRNAFDQNYTFSLLSSFATPASRMATKRKLAITLECWCVIWRETLRAVLIFLFFPL